MAGLEGKNFLCSTAQLLSAINHRWVQLLLASSLCHLRLLAATREASAGRRGTSTSCCQGSGPVSWDDSWGSEGSWSSPQAMSLQAEQAQWLQQVTRAICRGRRAKAGTRPVQLNGWEGPS